MSKDINLNDTSSKYNLSSTQLPSLDFFRQYLTDSITENDDPPSYNHSSNTGLNNDTSSNTNTTSLFSSKLAPSKQLPSVDFFKQCLLDHITARDGAP